MRDEDRGPKRNLRTPAFVGRQENRRALDAAVDRALKFGAPQFVTVIAPAGMGKTRLLAEWTRHLDAEGLRRIDVSVAPLLQESAGEVEPFGVIAALLRARFGFGETRDADAELAAFRAELQRVFGDRRVAEVAALLGRFLGLSLPESPLGQALSTRPEQETDLARAVLCRFLEEDARARPLVIVIDDLHLADDRSLEVLERLAAELGDAAFVLVAAGRPELCVRRPDWGRGEGSQTRVDLPPLSPLEMDVFMRSVLDVEALAPGLADRAAIESGGNPFLLERLLRAYQQHGILSAQGTEAWAFDAERAGREAVPLGPEATAQARLADLSPAERDLLARAATFGPTFFTGGAIALGRLGCEPRDPATVFAPDPVIEDTRRMLASLRQRDHLIELPSSTIPGETEWSFCDPAERTVLLATVDPEVLRRRRRFAAQWVEGRTAGRATSERYELLGTLYEEGGDAHRAGQCFIAAGDEARRRLRHDRARSLYLRGARLLDVDDAVFKMDTFHKLGDVAARLGRAREALAHFGEMLKLAWRLDLPAKGGAAHARIGRLHRGIGDYKLALKHLDLAHLLFDLAGDRAGIAATLDDIGRVHLLKGNFEESLVFHRAALVIREELGDARGRALTLSWMGLTLSQMGDLTAAESHFRRALELSREARDGHGIVFSLLDLGRVEREGGRPERAQPLLEEARGLAREMGERLYECNIGVQIGECLLQQGRGAEADAEFRAAREIAQRFGARRLVAEAGRGLAEARLLQGDVLGARDTAYDALGIAEAIGASPLAGASLRVLATAVASGAPGDADRGGPREMFDRAVEMLGKAGAELELGRTLAAYADFEERTGRDDAAFDLRLQAQWIWARARAAAPPA
jgi:tetratricopeptide (TPR) repeat protein